VAYRVYVLQNPEGRFYVDVTEDVSRRVQQHNEAPRARQGFLFDYRFVSESLIIRQLPDH
jgi:predicted GIY-YIG superfamily endonuclease